MEAFQCPFLGGLVELNDERERHIAEKHSQLLPNRPDHIATTLADPDLILRKDPEDETILFYRWFYDLDKYVLVAVVNHPGRDWIITAFVTRRLQRGEIIWQRR
ncbi:MAG: hypothetical protein OXL37_00105 [Chloroflexota bacterium]|nr:hypothetical protein [Chloroflexota bacterium]MDE2959427.1 hypothetical protein [Chloroflexota bacterium]